MYRVRSTILGSKMQVVVNTRVSKMTDTQRARRCWKPAETPKMCNTLRRMT